MAIDSEPWQGWNDCLSRGSSGSLHLFHLTAWAERLDELLGYEPLYITVRRKGVPVVMLLGFREAATGARVRGSHRVKALLQQHLLRRRGFRWYGQPVLIGDTGVDPFRMLGAALKSHLKLQGFRLCGGEWPLIAAAALPKGWRSRRWGTYKVDLSQDLATLLARCKPAARKEIRKAVARGIEVHRIQSEDEIRAYAEEAVNCALRYGKTNVSIEDYLLTWRQLRNEQTFFETFIARHDGRFVAGLSIWGTHHSIAELGSFQSEYAYELKLSGPDLLKWRVIDWAKSKGIRVFDLAGVNPVAKEGKELNIRRFKEKWGGVFEEFLVVED